MVPGREIRTALRGLLAALVTAGGAMAQEGSTGGDGRSGGRYGWGPHFGLAGDPDQLILGLHFDVGRIAPRVRFQPDVELGLGDDHTIFAFTLPAHYVFRTSSDLGPYAGGGIVIGLDDHDRAGRDDDTDVEMAIALTGGLEWRTSGRDRYFLELNLMAGDLHDFQVVGGLTF
jgi:hypothetical protein